ncbi:hypothetical protein SLI_6065 [Streptomyces lividans 1326]|uniref:Uncharacterized protein n=1 Tax=Streptomyces lividans 1326 TaxID=1200984 RepID=A0A7U9DV85_STRLI|nr:hypothetical protein SLI_6065 [Streptomyces lividans 1326]
MTGRPRSVQAESVPSTEGATASQCSGKEPRSSGEYRRASSSGEALPALRGGMQRVAEEQGLFGGEEEVGSAAFT